MVVVMSERPAAGSDVLIEAGLILASELSLPSILQKIVDLACVVSDARYGALGILTPEGREIHDFITVGVTEEERRTIGQLPRGHGLLGALITDARPLRLRRIQDDPRSVGFPPHHPPMTSFLGVPVKVRGKVFGNLYLTEKRAGGEFTEEDQRHVETLAAQAAVAIENAHLRDELQRLAVVEDRERIAKELHDGVIQSLYALGLSLQATAQMGDVPEVAQKRITVTIDDIDRVIRDLRSYIFALRPGDAADFHVILALGEIVESLTRGSDIPIEADIDPDVAAQVSRHASAILQVAREALSNAVRHSGATRITLALNDEEGAPVLEIRDDGRGFDLASPSEGHGMRNLRVRAAELGAQLDIETAEGKGTTVRLTLPR